MKILEYAKGDETLYETIERAMRSGAAVFGWVGDVEERFASIKAATKHANTYGLETLSVRKVRK